MDREKGLLATLLRSTTLVSVGVAILTSILSLLIAVLEGDYVNYRRSVNSTLAVLHEFDRLVELPAVTTVPVVRPDGAVVATRTTNLISLRRATLREHLRAWASVSADETWLAYCDPALYESLVGLEEELAVLVEDIRIAQHERGVATGALEKAHYEHVPGIVFSGGPSGQVGTPTISNRELSPDGKRVSFGFEVVVGGEKLSVFSMGKVTVDVETEKSCVDLLTQTAWVIASKERVWEDAPRGLTRMLWKGVRAKFFIVIIVTYVLGFVWALTCFRKRSWAGVASGVTNAIVLCLLAGFEPVLYWVTQNCPPMQVSIIENGLADALATTLAIVTLGLYTFWYLGGRCLTLLRPNSVVVPT